MDFYSTERQTLIGPVVMLPQAGSGTGGSKRPMNSFAILRDDHSILFDAPVSWALDGIRSLAEGGHPPRALVLSHRNLCSSGDAFAALLETWPMPVLLHPDDQDDPEAAKAGVTFETPMQNSVLDGIDVIHIPGHTRGSIMLYVSEAGGILLAGDSAVAPGPEQSDRTPRLERSVGADADRAFAETWQEIVWDKPLSAVLPLHGECYLSEAFGSAAWEKMLRNIWTGAPMDPSRT